VRSRFAAFVDTYGAAMIPEEARPPDSVPSVKSEGIQPKQPKDWPQEDTDSARGEAFKRVFPYVPRKTPQRPKELYE
jgi:hypothetical protein